MTLNLPYNVLRYKERVFSNVIPYLLGETLLDSGCGHGEDDVLLSRHFKKVQACDIAEDPLWKERSGPDISFSVCSAEKLAFPDNSFDTVIEQNMLHHVGNPELALSEMVRVSKKRIIVLECNRYNPLLYVNMTLIHKHEHFSQKRLKQILDSAGVPYEMKYFSARSLPFNNKPLTDFFYGIMDLLEKFPPYRPIIEYNLAVLTKK
jgi:ubiquinone/menaquinone biosynthesis C-methylase UbiE